MFVYILECGDDSLYTGWTHDLQQRVKAHECGKASKYTRSRLPVRLLGWMRVDDASEAKSIEARFKQLTREQKISALASGEAFGFTLHKGS